MSGAAHALRPRLRRSDFLRGTRRGQRLVTPHFIVFIHDRRDDGPTRLGITVTRKVGNAVRRNRIKRMAREWFRGRSCVLGSCDLILIARRDFPEGIGQPEVARALEQSLASR